MKNRLATKKQVNLLVAGGMKQRVAARLDRGEAQKEILKLHQKESLLKHPEQLLWQ
jgi:hypothetical protein